MATLTVQTVDYNGDALSFTSCDSGGDEFDNSSGRVMIIIQNDDGSSHTATIASQAECNQGFTHNIDITVASGGEQQIAGFFGKGRFNDANDLVQITYDDVTSMSIAVVQVT